MVEKYHMYPVNMFVQETILFFNVGLFKSKTE